MMKVREHLNFLERWELILDGRNSPMRQLCKAVPHPLAISNFLL